MKKNLSSREIAMLFADKLEDESVISDVFDYLKFDCTVRCFIDPGELDEKIRSFYETKDMDTLTSIVEQIQNGKTAACMDEQTLFRAVKKYIYDNLSEDMKLDQVAKEFHLSYYYLSHIFKRMAKQSMNQFRTNKRLEKAIHLLLESELKIADIATECGFDNLSYFSEIFIKNTGETPSDFRKKYGDVIMHQFYELDDMLLAVKMKSARFMAESGCTEVKEGLPYTHIHDPGAEFGHFLHETAIIEYEGVLYASWYNCIESELVGYTPIVSRRSYDRGETWTAAQIIAEDKTENIMYCPPVYGICDGKLYMLLNQMVAPDHIHSLDLYVLNKETDRFEIVWSRPIPFKLNTNVLTLPNGKLMLPGRIAELDGFPNTPAVMISDSGKIDAQWRVVCVAPNGDLPDGENLVHPETTVIINDGKLYMFSRNDRRKVPLAYVSEDMGESWSEAMEHDIPYRNAKIYAGTLSDGRNYLIANTEHTAVGFYNRSKLTLFVSEEGEMKFTKSILLVDCDEVEEDICKCHYPATVEYDGVLYIIATADYKGDTLNGRGAVLFKVDIKDI